MSERSGAPQHLVPYRHDGWVGLINAGWRDEIASSDPTAWLDRYDGEPVPRQGAPRVVRIEHERGPLFVKRLSLPSDDGPDMPVVAGWRLLRRLTANPTMRAARIGAQLAADGLRAPTVVIAARRRKGFRREHVLITEAVTGTNFRRLYKDVDDAGERVRLVELVAGSVHELHAAGYIHGDLLPGNVIIDPETDAVTFIDHDRTRRVGRPSDRARRRNLEQAMFRLLRMAPYQVCRRFLRIYFEAAGTPDEEARRASAQILRRARRRFASAGLTRIECTRRG